MSSQITIGHVRLISNAEEFKRSFSRFADNSLNGWSQTKQELCGAEGNVVYNNTNDNTVSIIFEDKQNLNFPMESVAV